MLAANALPRAATPFPPSTWTSRERPSTSSEESLRRRAPWPMSARLGQKSWERTRVLWHPTSCSGRRASLERGIELSRVTNMAALRTLTYGLLGSARARLGDLTGGAEDWDEALASARQMGDRYGEAQTLWGRGRTNLGVGDWSAALPDIDRAVQLFEAMEARPSFARALHDKAEALRGLGQVVEAEDVDRRSAEMRQQLGLRDVRVS